MGEAKRKRTRQQQKSAAHPWCIYCGDSATTTDHCPPRAAFLGRDWPETYEFPACHPCNDSARRDEQVLVVLFRGEFKRGTAAEQAEWEKLAVGVKNNQPDIFAEWAPLSRNDGRRILRSAYGREGDRRRQQGWSAFYIGPLTQAVIDRFMIKLGKALYFKHNHHAFDGVLYTYHVDKLSKDTTPEYLASIYQMAPGIPLIIRNSKSLSDQFIYRFNHSPEHRVMYAVVEFGAQWVFQLIAVSREMDAELTSQARVAGETLSFRHECFLT